MSPEKKWILSVSKKGKILKSKEFESCDTPDYIAGYCQAFYDRGYDLSLVESIPSEYQYGFNIK